VSITNDYIRGDSGFDIEGSAGFTPPVAFTDNVLDGAHSKAYTAHMLATATWARNTDADTGATIAGP
jgi:hypothetical protein